MKKNIFAKKEYVKAEIEFVRFDYSEVCAESGDSEVKEAEGEEEEEGGDLLGALLPWTNMMAPSESALEDSEGEFDSTPESGFGEIFETSENTDPNSTTPVEQQEEQVEEAGGGTFIDDFANGVSEAFDALADEIDGGLDSSSDYGNDTSDSFVEDSNDGGDSGGDIPWEGDGQ